MRSMNYYFAAGAVSPFDQAASYWTHGRCAIPATDDAHATARAILSYLASRVDTAKGINRYDLSLAMRQELTSEIADLIREGMCSKRSS